MKKTNIYVDTSVIGGCCDVEFQEWSNGIRGRKGLTRKALVIP